MNKIYPAHHTHFDHPGRHGMEWALAQWGGSDDLWIFGYASLIWRPEFDFVEHRAATVHGFHRALKMWSRVNRGTPDCPGLVFALLPGGSCRGMASRVPSHEAAEALHLLWEREMPTGIYTPRWLNCTTGQGLVRALSFTLPKTSPSYTGPLDDEKYREIFARAKGRFGTTLDYARLTLDGLLKAGIKDRELARVVQLAQGVGTRCR